MPCPHKFAEDLLLERLDFQPEILIIGTFNPAWNILDNTAPWFYGRTRNNYFWDVLPRLFGKKPLRQDAPSTWKAFCRQHRIALTDFIASINDADIHDPVHIDYLKNFRDDLIVKHFQSFNFIDIPTLLAKHPLIKRVYLTRSINDRFWRQRWQPVVEYGNQQHILTQTLLTPSGSARFQIPKDMTVSLVDFIFTQWRDNW